MCAWIVPPVAGLIEPAPAPEFYVEAIGGIEISKGTVLVHLVTEQMPLEAGAGRAQQVLVVKLRGPLLNLPQVIGMLAQCLWRVPHREAEPPPAIRGPYLVR